MTIHTKTQKIQLLSSFLLVTECLCSILIICVLVTSITICHTMPSTAFILFSVMQYIHACTDQIKVSNIHNNKETKLEMCFCPCLLITEHSSSKCTQKYWNTTGKHSLHTLCWLYWQLYPNPSTHLHQNAAQRLGTPTQVFSITCLIRAAVMLCGCSELHQAICTDKNDKRVSYIDQFIMFIFLILVQSAILVSRNIYIRNMR